MRLLRQDYVFPTVFLNSFCGGFEANFCFRLSVYYDCLVPPDMEAFFLSMFPPRNNSFLKKTMIYLSEFRLLLLHVACKYFMKFPFIPVTLKLITWFSEGESFD